MANTFKKSDFKKWLIKFYKCERKEFKRILGIKQ